MIVMGLDISTTSTGLVVVDSTKSDNGGVVYEERIKTGTMGAKKQKGLAGQEPWDLFRSDSQQLRQWYIRQKVRDAWMRLKPDFVVIEGYSFMSKSSSVHFVYGVGEHVRTMLSLQKALWLDVPPSTLKKFATGDGRADKQAMIYSANQAGYHTGIDDLADAFHLASYGANNKHLIES